MHCFVDIESLPDMRPNAKALIEADLRAGWEPIKAPGNYKDEAKIAAFIADATSKREADLADDVDKAWRKTALDGAAGTLLSVAWALDEQPVVAATSAVCITNGDSASLAEVVEAELLGQFFGAIEVAVAATKRIPIIVAHHAEFDLRFLWQRAVAVGIPTPRWFPVDIRPWDRERVQDTMLMWAGTRGHIGLDRLCRALDLSGKTGIDGSMVYDLVAAGRITEVLGYNADDVRRLRSVWRRMNFMPPLEGDLFHLNGGDEIEIPLAAYDVVSGEPLASDHTSAFLESLLEEGV